jgi:hypothetical protein
VPHTLLDFAVDATVDAIDLAFDRGAAHVEIVDLRAEGLVVDRRPILTT